MTLEDRVAALATRIGQSIKAALAGKADDDEVVKLTGAQSVQGLKTFVHGVGVPNPSAANHPVRHDDARNSNARTPTGHATTHAVDGTDELSPEDIGAADAVHNHTAAEITDGTLDLGRLPVGTSGQSVAAGNDARFPPSGGTSGQVLTKASAGNHAMVWADPAGGGAGGTYISGTVPPGAATVTITHNLGTRDVVVMVRETTGYTDVPIANDAPDADTVRLVFSTAPTAGQYRYVVFAALGEPTQGPIAPTAHATTHASGGADPLTPGAIGAAESSHTHPATALTSGTLSLARLPTGTTGSTVAVGNHTHSGYAASSHTHSGYAAATHGHDAEDVTSGVFDRARMPPMLRGPWTQTSGFVSTNLAYIGTGRDTGGELTVPALGYDWMPMAAGQYAVRSDVLDTVPTLELTVDDPLGVVCARGFGYGSGRDMGWRPVPLSPVLGVVLSGSSSHTFYLWMRAGALGGWTESSNTGTPHITVYALPMEAAS